MDNSFHHCLLLAQTVFQKQVVLEAAGAFAGTVKNIGLFAQP